MTTYWLTNCTSRKSSLASKQQKTTAQQHNVQVHQEGTFPPLKPQEPSRDHMLQNQGELEVTDMDDYDIDQDESRRSTTGCNIRLDTFMPKETKQRMAAIPETPGGGNSLAGDDGAMRKISATSSGADSGFGGTENKAYTPAHGNVTYIIENETIKQKAKRTKTKRRVKLTVISVNQTQLK